MDFRQRRYRIVPAGLVIAVFCLFPVTGQTAADQSSAPLPLVISVTPEAVGAGDQVLVSFEVPHQLTDSAYITERPPQKLPGLYLVKGPYRNYLYDRGEDGTYTVRTKVRYYYASRSTGVKEIPTYRVAVPDGPVYESAAALVKVGEYSRRVLTFPLEVAWDLPKDTVYVGETLPLVLKVQNQDEISLIEGVSVTAPRGVFFEKAEGLEDISRVTVAGVRLYHIPAAVYMFIAPSPGRYFVPNAGVKAGGRDGESRTVAIDVLPLPDRVRTTGAVGTFTRHERFLDPQLYAGSEAVVEITVKGNGNLPFLAMPSPEGQDLVFSQAKEELSIQADSRGYHGERTFRYAFTPGKEGSVRVQIPEFPYFSDKTQKVVVLEGRTLTARVLPAPSFVRGTEADLLETLVPLPAEKVRSVQALGLAGIPSTYLAFLPLPLGFAVLLILRIRKALPGVFLLVLMVSAGDGFSPVLEQAYDLWDAGSFAQSGHAFAQAADAFPRNGALFYNMALCKVRTGNFSDALYLSRKALHLRPRDPDLQRLPGLIEQRMELVHQVEIPGYINPDYAFLGLIIGVNALAVIGILLLFRKNIVLTISAVLFSAFIIIAGVIEYQGVTAASRDLGTVNRAVHLKRIPKESAGDWLEVPEGTGVRILEDADGFLLIENGIGTRGWVPAETVFSHNDLTSWKTDGFWQDP